MTLIDTLNQSWRWTGLNAAAIVDQNDFGNLLIADSEGRYWHLCPEELSCKLVAADRAQFDTFLRSEDFIYDWQMGELAEIARDKLGPLAEGYKYCLKMPVLLGGEYTAANLGSAPLATLITFSGEVAQQLFQQEQA